MVNCDADELGAIPKIPSGNTIKLMESVVMSSFIEDYKSIIFAQNNPCCLSSDAVKKTGCLGVKVTPLQVTTAFEKFQFGMIYYTYLNNKHQENANILSMKIDR